MIPSAPYRIMKKSIRLRYGRYPGDQEKLRIADGSSFMMAGVSSVQRHVTAASPSLAQVASPFAQQLAINK